MGLFGFGKHNDEYNSIYSDSDRTGNCPYCTLKSDGKTDSIFAQTAER